MEGREGDEIGLIVGSDLEESMADLFYMYRT